MKDPDIKSSNGRCYLRMKIRVLSQRHDLWWECSGEGLVAGDKSPFLPLEIEEKGIQRPL